MGDADRSAQKFNSITRCVRKYFGRAEKVARDVWVSDEAKPWMALQGTVEPKQRDEGASVSSDAQRVCDASGAMN